jgi:hypothetical protein
MATKLMSWIEPNIMVEEMTFSCLGQVTVLGTF